MTAARVYRCSGCDEDWPAWDRFKTCPGCSEATWETNGRPLTVPEANRRADDYEKARANRARDLEAFEKYCAELERRRAQLEQDPDAAIAEVLAEAEQLLEASPPL